MSQSTNALVYVTDPGFLAISCCSLLSAHAAASDGDFDSFLFLVNVSEEQKRETEAFLASHGVFAQVLTIPEERLSELPKHRLPKSMYGRLLLHEFLPSFYERVLYSDGDTLIDIDLAEIFSSDLHGNTIGAVLDIGRLISGLEKSDRERLNLGPDGYFNSGVLLMDWAKWCSERIGPRCIEALQAEPERFKSPDQCALNMICSGAWQPLPAVFNYQPSAQLTKPEAKAVFHFLGNRKPWRNDGLRHEARFIERYRSFFLNSPWASQWPEGLGENAWQYEVSRHFKRTFTPRNWTIRFKALAILDSQPARARVSS